MEHRTSPTPTGTDQQKNQANRQAVLVTGASGGIGRAISQAFGEIGWYVGVHYYQNESAAETTLGQVLKVGGTGSTYAADVREPESVRRMFDQFSRNTQGPIAVVCNAGIGQSELLVRHADHIWDNVLATNLTGTFHCLRACAPLLLDRGGGSIIVIGSHTGFHGARGQSAYATSKAGLIGLVKTAALEWGPQNIRVNLLLPGWQKTDLTEGVFPEGNGWLDHALRRPPASEEMARTVVHLAQLRDVSGQVWNCDSRHL